MYTLFLFCAVLGGVVLVFQIVLTLIGADADSGGVDVAHDLGGHDFGMHDVGAHDLGATGHVDVSAGHDGVGDMHDADTATGVRVISVRTLVAGITFFGLGGLGAQSTGAGPFVVWAVALLAGAAAMYSVYWMFATLYSLRSDGTVRIANALGRHGSVYLRIPANESGMGKVQINMQSRTVEYLATTAGEALPTGAGIVVVDIVTPTTVRVEPLLESERNNDV